MNGAWKWVATALAGVIALGLGGYTSMLRGDVGELRPRVRVVETRLAELSGKVLAKLESIEAELQQHKSCK